MPECLFSLLAEGPDIIQTVGLTAPTSPGPGEVAFASRVEIPRSFHVQQVRVLLEDGRECLGTLKQGVVLQPDDWVDVKMRWPNGPDDLAEVECGLRVWARDTPLIRAAKEGDVAEVERLLAAGVDPSATGRHGHSALYEAAKRGDPAIVQHLLDAGANPNEVGYAIALHEAASQGHEEIVRLLLSSGASPDLGGSHGQTALECAAGRGRVGVVRILLDAGARGGESTGGFGDMMGQTALHDAVEAGSLEIVELLLERGWQVNAMRHLMRRNHKSQTPLDIALANGNEELADCLLARGGMTAREAYPNWFEDEDSEPTAGAV
jgi:ankyrin repeat protein